MIKNNKKKEMKDFVGEYFIRVCKNHGIYGTFRQSFYSLIPSSKNPFGRYKNIPELLEGLQQFSDKEYEVHCRGNDKYEKVTMMINHMIHFFLERGGIDSRKLGMIGQEIFDLSCYAIYGDEFIEDMENMQQPKPRNEKEAYLLGIYLSHLQSGQMNMSWEDFLAKYMPQIERGWGENQGHNEYEDEYDDYPEGDVDDWDEYDDNVDDDE